MKTNVNSRRRSKRSRGRKRRVVAVLTLFVLAVAIVAIVRGALVRAPRVAAIPQPAPSAAPRLPEAPPWTESQLGAARRMLAATFAPVLGESDRASLVVLGAHGETIYSRGEHVGVTPASVQKLIVAYTSLNLLGPNYRFRTMLAAEEQPNKDGVLEGNLWLVGSGDPSFRSGDLRSGIASLHDAGLTTVDGGVAVDPTIIRGPEINPQWNPSDAGEDFQAAVSGVSLDGDTIEFRVYGGAPGQPARIVMVPANGYARVEGGVTTSGGADSVIIDPEAENVFRFSGYVPPGVEEKFWLPVHGIGPYAASVMQTMLAQAGVRTMRGPSVSAAPIDSIVLWEHRSAPLPALVKHMLYVSDNHYAEQLLRTVGADAGGAADDRDGIDAEVTFLHSRSIPTEGMRTYDGSGLAEADRVSALTLARILSDAELRDGGAELYPLLPAGGRDGTLKHYSFTTQGVRAKTGHLSDADSLAGYVDTKHHGRLAFAFMIDNSPGDPDDAYVHALDSLAEY